MPRYLNESIFQLNENLSLSEAIKAGGMLIGKAEHLDRFTLRPVRSWKMARVLVRLGREIRGSVINRSTSSA